MKEAMAPCIVCGSVLDNVDETATNQPYAGTCFETHGHYGSTAFDPMNGEYLEIVVCDECLRKKAEAGAVLHGRDKVPVVTEMRTMIGWAKRVWALVPWDPASDRDDGQIAVGTWDDFQETRSKHPIETRMSDSEIKKTFEYDNLWRGELRQAKSLLADGEEVRRDTRTNRFATVIGREKHIGGDTLYRYLGTEDPDVTHKMLSKTFDERFELVESDYFTRDRDVPVIAVTDSEIEHADGQ